MSERFPPIAELVPHGPPMILVDELVRADEDSVTTRVRIREDSVFAEDGRVPAALMVEHMAQSIAAYVGLGHWRKGEKPRIGFLIGIRRCSLAVDWLLPGDELVVEVRRLWGEVTVGSFEGSVSRGGERIATGTLSVYQGPLGDLEAES